MKRGAVKPRTDIEDKGKGEGAAVFGHREVVATCTGERVDSQTADRHPRDSRLRP